MSIAKQYRGQRCDRDQGTFPSKFATATINARRTLLLAAMCGLLAGAGSQKPVSSTGGDPATFPGFYGERNILKETADVADCYSGIDRVPSPEGSLDVAGCRAAFDDNEDGDIDLADYHEYLLTIPPGLELGNAYGQPYDRLIDGDTLPVYQGGQGGIHVFLTIRSTGTANGAGFQDDSCLCGPTPCARCVRITRGATRVDTGATIVPTGSFAHVFSVGDGGVLQFENLFIPLLATPGQVDGVEVEFNVKIELFDDPSVYAIIKRRLVLDETGIQQVSCPPAE